MDEKVAKWIIEFLLRKPIIDERIIDGVLSCLPFSINDYRLKKTLLLRKIDSETTNGSVSEKLLELLETVEELDHREGKTASDKLKGAYCAVAVDCTLRFLEEIVEENGKYFEAVEKIWRNRVCHMEGLASDESNHWLQDIEAAIWNSELREKILKRNTRNEALKAVRGYLKEAWKSMGPAFLELVAAKVGDELEKLLCDAVVSSGNPCRELVAFQGMQKGQSLVRLKHMAVKTCRTMDDKLPICTMDKCQAHQCSSSASDLQPDACQAACAPSVTKVTDNSNDVKAAANGFNPDIHSSEVTRVQECNSFVNDLQPDACDAARAPSVTKVIDNSNDVKTAEYGTNPVMHSPGVTRVHECSSSVSDLQHVASQAARAPDVTKVTDNSNDVKAAENRTNPVIHSPEVTRVQEALRLSARELRAAVTDPLPEAVEMAKSVCSNAGTHNHEAVVGNQKGAEACIVPEVGRAQQAHETSSTEVHPTGKNPSADASQRIEKVSSKTATNNVNNDAMLANQTQPGSHAPRGSTEKTPEKVDKDDLVDEIEDSDTNSRKQLRKRKRNLMEPNSTSHTMEWDDSNDNERREFRVRLPASTSRSKVSPLNLYVEKKFVVRRVRKRWTPQEEDALREGVKRFGRSWKNILECYRVVFEDRTDIDLKDKWRNMTR
ncbi:uncharacterized protein LOC130797024 [Amaranthus tricolor]|uniref:uncharacterized protein LOC130797024 n=1 Tax=Amaranthus tricolor TaxID=29722 RepID=UPI0025896727|nr:uncharacterized protein LOC130797024 [Amaranthus tricolor]